MAVKVGLVGTNTSHAGTFANLLNGECGADPRVAGGRVVALWSSGLPGATPVVNPGPAELAAHYDIDRVVDDPSDMIDAIDAVLILDDAEGGGRHAQFARPFLDAGLPTFIDKPMALDLHDAVDLFDLADQRGAALMSTSALRFASELRVLTDSAEGLGEISSVVGVSPGSWDHYGVHAVEMLRMVAGPGATTVHQHPGQDRDVTVIDYDHGPVGVIETLRNSAYFFHLVAYGSADLMSVRVRDFEGFFAETMTAFLQMARTQTAPIAKEETLDILGVLAAGRRSAQTGQPVAVAEMFEDAL